MDTCLSKIFLAGDTVVAGNKRFLPYIIEGETPLDRYDLVDLLKPLGLSVSMCCAARCFNFALDAPGMQGWAYYYRTSVGCANHENGGISKFSVGFIGNNFHCGCNLHSFENHVRDHADCPIPGPDWETYCCDHWDYIRDKCKPLPKWSRYRLG